MSDAIVVTARFEPAEERRHAVLGALHQVIPQFQEEPGCLFYEVFETPDGAFVTLEKWATQDDLDAHGQGSAIKQLAGALEGALAGHVVITPLTPVVIGDDHKADL